MCVNDWENSRLSTTYNLHSIRASRGPKGRPSGGILVGWDKRIDVLILDSNENFCVILDTKMHLFIFFVYLQPNDGYSEALSVLFEKIENFSLPGRQVLVIGDFNGRIGSLNTTVDPRSSMDSTVNHRGKLLFEKISESGLNIGNGCISGDTEGAYTFISESVLGASVCDLLLFSPASLSRIQNFEVLNWTHSDHFPLTVALLSAESHTHLPQMSKKKICFPTTHEDIQLFVLKLEMKLPPISESEHICGVNELNERMISEILNTCEEVHLIKYPAPIPVAAKPQWFDTECKAAKTQVTSLIRKHRREVTQSSARSLDPAYFDAKCKYNELKNEKIQAFEAARESRLLNVRDSANFWKTIKSFHFKPPTLNTITKAAWFTHFSNVFSTAEEYQIDPIEIPANYIPDTILDADFSVPEIWRACRSLKSNKAAGSDLVPNEILKNASLLLLSHLCLIFQLCYSCGRVPLS